MEHTWKQIELPAGSYIKEAKYEAVAGDGGLDVTDTARRIVAAGGALMASTKLFGDPAKKKRKQLSAQARVPVCNA